MPEIGNATKHQNGTKVVYACKEGYTVFDIMLDMQTHLSEYTTDCECDAASSLTIKCGKSIKIVLSVFLLAPPGKKQPFLSFSNYIV